MIDLPDASTFSDLFASRQFYAALAVAALAGLVRGFSGFGSALIYVPLISAIYEPRIAAVTFVLSDFVTGMTFLSGIWKRANWREVLPMVICAVLAVQFGTLILQRADPVSLRWALVCLIAVVLVVLASGWRYHGKPSLAITIAVGLSAGLIGGAVQISGPPIIVYWLGSGSAADVLRANFFAYFSLFSLASIVTYFLHGIVTAKMLALAIAVTPLYMGGMAIGTRLFGFASEGTYRRAAYVIVALSAIISMPLFDRFFH